MQLLFLVFLAAAWLNELVLAVGLAQNAETRRASLTLGLAAGMAALVPAMLASRRWPGWSFEAIPPKLSGFLFAFCFICVLMQVASGRAGPSRLGPGQQRWRVALPVLSGNLAVVAYSITQGMPQPVTVLGACLGLTIALALLAPVATAVLDRLQVSLVPAPMRGTPIVILSSAIAALGLMGLGPVLPW